MAEKVKEGDTKLPNVKALQEFRLKGDVIGVGDVVAKADFPNKGTWLNLLNMPKPRVEETDDKLKRSTPAERVAAVKAAKGAGNSRTDAAKAPGA